MRRRQALFHLRVGVDRDLAARAPDLAADPGLAPWRAGDERRDAPPVGRGGDRGRRCRDGRREPSGTVGRGLATQALRYCAEPVSRGALSGCRYGAACRSADGVRVE